MHNSLVAQGTDNSVAYFLGQLTGRILFWGLLLLVVVKVLKRVSRMMSKSAPIPPPPTAAVPPTVDTSAVAPGWYADPSSTGNQRYWDGQQWTEHVSDPGA